jgi:hypothetical protein
MRPPTSATLIGPDQPFQRQGPFETSNQCNPDHTGLISPYRGWGPMRPPTSATLIRPDQPLQRLGPFETPNQCDPDPA